MSLQGGDRRSILDGNALVPIGAVVAGISILLGGWMWLNARFDALQSQVSDLRVEAREVQRTLLNQWTVTDQALFAERLKSGNPTLNIPVVRDR